MRLHRLEIEGFGPFRDRQRVDFDAFATDGIFLIAGRTGAGKSSILDAVCFGLYGAVPRYDDGEKRLRSDHCQPDDPSEVVVEFSTSAGRFRVTRSPEYLRPSRRGPGMTKQPAAVALHEWTDAGWVGRATRAVDVARALEGIVQLNQQQFLQVILLAQNRFAQFLLADSRERQGLLRRLFGTERFDDVQARFEQRRRESERSLDEHRATIAARLDEAERVAAEHGLCETDSADAPAVDAAGETDERISALRRAQAAAAARAERAVVDRDDAERALHRADAALGRAREEEQAQRERQRLRQRVADLEAQAPDIAGAVLELDRARAAESLRGPLATASRTAEALLAAEEQVTTARARWSELGHPLENDSVEGLRAWAAEHTAARGAWQRAAERERDHDAREAALAAAHDAVAAASHEVELAERQRDALPERIARLTEEHDLARRAAEDLDALASARQAALARRDGAVRVRDLLVEQSAAAGVLADATDELARTAQQLAELRRRRLDGFAGELAAGLAVGSPCPVCGSAEHPAPAARTDPVSADDVSRAEELRDAAAEREHEAAAAVAALQIEHAAAEERAGGRTEAAAQDEVDALDAAYRTASERAERADTLKADLAAAQRRAGDAQQRCEQAALLLAAAREEAALQAQRVAADAAEIRAACGGYPSVADRLAAAAAEIDAATALVEALRERERCAGAAAEAAAHLDAARRDGTFSDIETGRAALRSPAEQESLATRIAAHGAQLDRERSALLDLERRALPEENILLAPVEEHAGLCRGAWVRSVEEATAAGAAAQRLGALTDAAVAEHERTAERRARHELLRDLSDALAGRGANSHRMPLETFVLAAELEEIVDAANRRLGDMSAGRYQLRHSDARAARGAVSGLGIVVFDAFTGETRPASSLSGGETFLGSLALALGLAEVVTARAGGIRLDTLFIDEGFGSLDAETLDVAMSTLDDLRQGGRIIGVISHVEAMQERLPAQLRVRASASGPSTITM